MMLMITKSSPAGMKRSRLAQMPDARSVELGAGRLTLSLFEDPSEIESEWRELENSGVCSLYQSFDWVSAWCKHAARARGESSLIVVGLDSANRTALILPMAVSQRGGRPILTWLGQESSSYNMGLFRRDTVELLKTDDIRSMLFVIARHLDVAAAEFTGQPETWDGIRNPFLQVASHPSHVRSYERRLERDFEHVYDCVANSKSRGTLRRKQRKLEELGEVRVVPAETLEDRMACFDIFLRQKSRQFEEQGVPNHFAEPGLEAFYREYLSALPGSSGHQCTTLQVGGETSATFIGARFKERFYFLSASLGPGEARRWSPGLILMREVVASQCDAGSSWLDLGPGDGQHKDMWKGHRIPLFETRLAFEATAWPAVTARMLASRTKNAVKNRPALLRTARGIRAAGRALRRKGSSQAV